MQFTNIDQLQQKINETIKNTPELSGKELQNIINVFFQQYKDAQAEKEAESEFCSLYIDSPVIQFFVDNQGKIMNANQKAVETFSPQNQHIENSTFFDYLDEKNKRIYADHLKKVFDSTIKNEIITSELLVKFGPYQARFYEIRSRLYYHQKQQSHYCHTLFLDITQLKEKKIAQKSEEKYKAVFESSPNAIYIIDLSGKILECNDAAVEMSAFKSKDEIIGLNGMSFIDKLHVNKANIFYDTLQNKKSIKNQEFKMITRNGEIRYREVSASLVNDEYNNPLSFVVISKDITDRKIQEIKIQENSAQLNRLVKIRTRELEEVNKKLLIENKQRHEAQQVLKRNEKLYKTLASNIQGTNLFLMDNKLNFILIEVQDLKIFGIQKETYEGKNLRAVTNDNNYNYMRKYYDKALEDNIIIDEVTFENNWYNLRIVPIKNQNNEIQNILTIAQNITEYKKTQHALLKAKDNYQKLVEDMPFLVCRWLPDGRLTFVNSMYCEYFNRSPEELIGNNFLDYIPKETHKYVWENISKLTPENSIISIDHPVKSEYGTRWQRWTDRAFFDKNGNITSLQSLGQDITELRNARLETDRALKKAEELNQLKSQFISTVSHEFRTPLASIRSNSQLLHKYSRELDEVTREKFFKRIFNATKLMSVMLDEVSFVGKDQNGRLSFVPHKIDFEQFCSDVIEETLNYFEINRKIELIFHHKIGVIYIDENLLRQALINVLNNAIKYSDNESLIYFSVSKNKDSSVMMRITDKGAGIDKKDLEHVFEPFYRGKNVKNIKGTGLGMSIVKRSIELHNGNIHIDSQKGKGTAVTIEIPVENVLS